LLRLAAALPALLLCAPAGALPPSRVATEVVPLGPEAPPIDAATAPKNRSYLQAAMTKVRPGAMLKADVPPYSPPPELRGRLARARDEAVQAHYARIAEMDYLADGAAKERDSKLSERIDTVRRHEIQRFFRQMQWLHTQVLSFWERRLP
jgi:hypothetical protein